MEPILLDQIRMEVVGEVLNNHGVKYFYTAHAATKFSKTLLSIESFLTTITKLVLEETIDAIVDATTPACSKAHC